MNSLSVEALKEIVVHCQENEERLRQLARRTRHERKKIERFLEENHSNQSLRINSSKTSHRVRFNLDKNETYDDNDERRSIFSINERKPKSFDRELADLARRCENLLTFLHQHKKERHFLQSTDDDELLDDRFQIQEDILRNRLEQYSFLTRNER